MMPRLPIRCRVPEDRVTNEIRWLEIEEGDGGYYLFQYVDINAPPRWDVFSDDLEGLLEDCMRIWGVDRTQWE